MNPRIRIYVAFGLLAFFALLIWNPVFTGQVAGGEPQKVVVILKAHALSNGITGAVSADDSVVELRAATEIAQQEVLNDVNAPSLMDRITGNTAPDVEAERTLEIVPAMIVEATPEGIEELKAHPLVEAVYPNIDFELLLSDSVPLINADDVWPLQINGNSVDGSDVSVCVIDTGISLHTAFQSRVVDQKCYCSPNCCPNGQSVDDLAADVHPISHGTHVSGIIAANGQYKGVAPGANIVSVKVCGTTCALADIISGMDYCLQVKETYNVVAISGSLGDGGNYQTQEQCPTFFDSAINAAFDAGVTSVFASGNNGYLTGISYPGCSPNAIGVGAVDKSDVIASFSNRGSLLDVLAPGVSITSTKAGEAYGALSGTSQATPHVSGVVALVQQVAKARSIQLTPAQIRQILQDTGVSIGSWKRVDALAAVQSVMPQNTAPVAAITAPSEGATLQSPVTLEGSATDTEDGTLAPESLSWSSDISGNLGTGNSLQATLTAGQHTITLTAIDSTNAVDAEVVHVAVQAPNTPPEVVISTPTDNAILQNPVAFTGTATDAEDGALTGVWKEGETILGSGNNLVRRLAPGQHTVAFTAIDSQSADSEDSVVFYAWTCHVTLDHDDNGVDIGDFVVLLEQFAGESLSCISPQSGCIVELDRNGNGLVDIGDFISLLTSFSQGAIQDMNGQPCQA